MGAEQSQLSSNDGANIGDVENDPTPSPGLTTISFKINGILYTIDVTDKAQAINSKSRLVDFIRDKALLKGTKFMCREGGCGACVVSVKESTNSIKSVNSCLIPVLSCDGWEITTIENLGNKKSGYHEIQKQMIKFGGTQCGFCTSGMVMHMYSFLQAAGPNKPKQKDIEDSLDGNICRCTGYRPILDAFKSFGTVQPRDGEFDIEDAASIVCPMKLTQSTNGISNHDEFEVIHDERSKLFRLPLANPNRNDASSEVWIKATTLADVFTAINKFVADKVEFRIVAGNTSTGIYKHDADAATGFINILNIPILTTISTSENEVILGAATSLSATINALRTQASIDGWSYVGGICQHLKRIANTSVRNVGTLAGNLMIKHSHRDFPSDLFITLETSGALLKIATDANTATMFSVKDFLAQDMKTKLILSIHLKPLKGNYVYRSYKISKRYQNAHGVVNAGFLFNVDKTKEFTLSEPPSIVYGGINNEFIHAEATQTFLNGKSLQNSQVIQDAMTTLGNEIKPEAVPLMDSIEYRKLLAQALLYKAILSVLGTTGVKPELQSGGKNIKRNLTSGTQSFDTDSKDWPINQPLPKLEAAFQCSGEAEYINDIHMEPHELIGVFVLSTVGNADIGSVDTTEALKDPNVVRFVEAKDIPGVNNYMIGLGGTPEPTFADGKVSYAGQPIGLIVAKTELAAKKAATLVKVNYTNIKKPILTIKDALNPPKVSDNLKDPPAPKGIQIKGEFEIGSQYHFHMETQICICKPKEDGMDVISSTQWMDFIQDAVAAATGLPNHEINVQVKRLGGGFGSKITRAAHTAAATSVAAFLTNLPVRVNLDLQTNMEMMGKRPPYLIDYEVEVEEATGKILSLKTNINVDAGMASNEEAPAGAKYYMQNCYDNSKWVLGGQTAITNLPANTWCRAPGTTQGVAIIEYIMEHIAFRLKKDPLDVRKANFAAPATATNSILHRMKVIDIMREGTSQAKNIGHELGLETKQIMDPPVPPAPKENILLKMIDEAKANASYDERNAAVEEFNKTNRWKKRGLALLTMRYPLAIGGPGFPAHISVYKTDGTVAISFGGIEMGQGINTKVAQVVAKEFGIDMNKVRVKHANNLVAPNGDSTGGSSTSELCCYAAMMACQIILARMKPVKDKLKKEPSWEELVKICARIGIDLSASYMYTKNDPVFGYDIWAVNITQVEIDVLTGEYKIMRVDLLEDVGNSLNPAVDVGQIEGALVFGLGLWTTEKLIFDSNTGQLLTNGTWEYKPPEPKDIPEDLRISLLKNAPNPLGVLRSKATGEPATCTSVCVLFAIRNAIEAARKDVGNTEWFQINGPISPQDISRLCLTSPTQFTL